MALNFVPPSHEQPYYEGLFATADIQRQGSIGGAQAVQFFSRSKLPVEVLKSIWTVADQNPNNNALDRRKFAIAVRLIQLAQNGVKGQGPQLDAPPGVVLRPVYFEGVSGVTVPMPPPPSGPPPQQQQQPQSVPMPPPPPHHQQSPIPQQHPQVQQQQQQLQQPPHPPHHPGLPPLAPHARPPGHHVGGGPPGQPASPQRPPHSPNARAMTPTPTAGTSLALTIQDPYTLLPNEQARYEGLFPQYAQPDGFVYGKEAVDLFNKSGLSQDVLRDIWNMVDSPVDNRLDKLEFAIAMHMIVCVSKKNLPVPKELPVSLKGLKAQQQQPQQSHPPSPHPQQPLPHQLQQQQQQPAYGQPSPATVPPMSFQHPPEQHMHPPQQQQRQIDPMQLYQHQPMRAQPSPLTVPPSIPSPTLGSLPSVQHSVPSMYPSPQPSQQQHYIQPSMSGSVGPPPIYQAQSHAQESLAEESHNTAPLSEPRAMQQSTMNITDAFEGLTSLAAREGYAVSLPEPPENRPPPSFGLSSAYLPDPDEEDEDDAVEEIPVPSTRTAHYHQEPSPAPPMIMEKPKTTKQLASSYAMGDDQVELSKLKAVLQKLQAENISLKAQLGSMTEEERNIHKEMAATIAEISKLSTELTTLRAQVLAAKSRLLEASAELKTTKEKKSVLSDLISETRATKEAMDAANEGIHDAQEQLHIQQYQPPATGSTTYNGGGIDLFSFDDAPAMGAPAPLPAPSTMDHHPTNYNPQQQQPPPTTTDHQPVVNHYHHNHLEEKPAAVVKEVVAAAAPEKPHANDPNSVFRQPEPMNARGVSTASSTAYSAASFEQEGLMGGVAVSAAARPALDPSRYAPGSDAVKDVEHLKARAVDAEQTARDAEEARRVLVAQAEELRRVADEAEALYRELQSSTEHSKKGFLGRGKKKDVKAIETAQHDAQEKKKKFLAVQSQANDAQAVALETKREAERLKQEAEQAELNVASLASLEQQPPTNGGFHVAPTTANIGSYGTATSNGYPTGFGGGGGYHHQEKRDSGHSVGGGFGGGAMGYNQHQGGFAPNVMARGGKDDDAGGFSIPSPEELKEVGDAYSNPFSL